MAYCAIQRDIGLICFWGNLPGGLLAGLQQKVLCGAWLRFQGELAVPASQPYPLFVKESCSLGETSPPSSGRGRQDLSCP